MRWMLFFGIGTLLSCASPSFPQEGHPPNAHPKAHPVKHRRAPDDLEPQEALVFIDVSETRRSFLEESK